VAERVATDVTVIGGVRERADSYAVENDPDYTVEDGHLTSLRESAET
jgi:hypothetical protein